MAQRAISGPGTFTCLVTGSALISDIYRRVHLLSPDLLAAIGHHPTMWARFLIPRGLGTHERAFTVINADLVRGTFDLDVLIHESPAARWTASAVAGDTILATLRGTGFAGPRATSKHMHLIGDAASVPAVRTILQAFPRIPATLWMEDQGAQLAGIPSLTRDGDTIVRVPRGDGTRLTAAVESGLRERRATQGLVDDWFWLACEASANRALMMILRRDLGVPRSSISAMAYWRSHG